ncbi:small redox-active disulfide protein 2 [Halobacteroides halobius DSM 5150]|uniref:Small redox-active disulfide protein 2 n=1 Tax=Halobacteroides halobius (strain ATCC 35273 / DSM 5150 / MD-1) TaxID=748449 RepID=L0KAP4_HALHC|nr:thioredoxin family protein [Halobacteroides halobius]AGB42086.1 small redox-active disulfide protein 2 [Halobacteroides halobius DSM 5150]
MKITVYGPGCKNCVSLADNAKEAVEELGIDAKVEKVEDMAEIAKAGVMSTPGLAIDGKVKIKGRVPSKDEIKKLLK